MAEPGAQVAAWAEQVAELVAALAEPLGAEPEEQSEAVRLAELQAQAVLLEAAAAVAQAEAVVVQVVVAQEVAV